MFLNGNFLAQDLCLLVLVQQNEQVSNLQSTGILDPHLKYQLLPMTTFTSSFLSPQSLLSCSYPSLFTNSSIYPSTGDSGSGLKIKSHYIQKDQNLNILLCSKTQLFKGPCLHSVLEIHSRFMSQYSLNCLLRRIQNVDIGPSCQNHV